MEACGIGGGVEMGGWEGADLTPFQGGRGLGQDILASHSEAERGGVIPQRCGERQLHGGR